jgi:hypothetical protein
MTRTMTHGWVRSLLLTLLLVGVAGGVAACGKYGPPQPYPPEVEEPDDEDDRR